MTWREEFRALVARCMDAGMSSRDMANACCVPVPTFEAWCLRGATPRSKSRGVALDGLRRALERRGLGDGD